MNNSEEILAVSNNNLSQFKQQDDKMNIRKITTERPRVKLAGSSMDIVAENVDGESQSHSSMHHSMSAQAQGPETAKTSVKNGSFKNQKNFVQGKSIPVTPNGPVNGQQELTDIQEQEQQDEDTVKSKGNEYSVTKSYSISSSADKKEPAVTANNPDLQITIEDSNVVPDNKLQPQQSQKS